MILLLIDPQQAYQFPSDVIQYTIDKVPKSMKTAGILLQIMNTMGFDGTEKKIAFLEIDKLSKSQVNILSDILYNVGSHIKVVLTTNNITRVDDAITNLGLKNVVISRGGHKRDDNIYTKLSNFLSTRTVPDPNDLYIMFRVFGHSPGISDFNRDLLCELDQLLFKTNGDYIAMTWAMQHETQKQVRLVFPKRRKTEDKVEEITARKYSNKIKKQKRAKKDKMLANLEGYF